MAKSAIVAFLSPSVSYTLAFTLILASMIIEKIEVRAFRLVCMIETLRYLLYIG